MGFRSRVAPCLLALGLLCSSSSAWALSNPFRGLIAKIRYQIEKHDPRNKNGKGDLKRSLKQYLKASEQSLKNGNKKEAAIHLVKAEQVALEMGKKKPPRKFNKIYKQIPDEYSKVKTGNAGAQDEEQVTKLEGSAEEKKKNKKEKEGMLNAIREFQAP